MLNCLKIIRHFSRNEIFFTFSSLAIFSKILNKEWQKMSKSEFFLQKIMFFAFFSQNFQKHSINPKKKKKVTRVTCLNMIFKQFQHFNSKLFFLACHTNFLTKM